MNIVKTLDQYDENAVYFSESIKNNVMVDGQFIRILYSTPNFSLNGIYLFFNIRDVFVEKYFNKYKCSFDIANHREICDKLCEIEYNILKRSNIKKIPQYKVQEQVMSGHIKIFYPMQVKYSNMGFLLKISGVWETETHCGITYKFSKVDNNA
jgi:hypothetical protein